MPPPVSPYDRANPPGSSNLTQSNDDARQQANKAQGYNPDALQRVLDWIGRQLGSDRAASRPGPSAGSRVVDWIGRQFETDPYRPGGSKNPHVTDPYDRRNPAVDAWFRALENSPTPFGNVQYGPPNKPVTKISSAPKIAQKISPLLSNSPPQMPGWLDTMPGEDTGLDPNSQVAWPPPINYGAMPGEDTGRDPNSQVAWPPPGPPQIDLSTLYPPDVNIFSQNPPRDATWAERVAAKGRVSPVPVRQAGPNTSASPFSRAEGGPIGLMRGGYPELYGSQGPVRHTFDSGGENFVGNEYGGTSGRADDVNAKLSPKEYVMDAELMALLGDGNPDHGAKKMDEMRANLRRQKGKALAKGKFSPAAKLAQEYLVGNPMGDGLRRRGRDKG